MERPDLLQWPTENMNEELLVVRKQTFFALLGKRFYVFVCPMLQGIKKPLHYIQWSDGKGATRTTGKFLWISNTILRN